MVNDDFYAIFYQNGINWKERKARTTRLFEYLTGGDCPFEAFELALGRDNDLKKQIVENMHQISYICDNFYVATALDMKMKKSEFLTKLYDSSLWGALLKVMKLPVDWQVSDATPRKALKMSVPLPWKSIYYHSLNVLIQITDVLCDNKTERFLEKIVKMGTVEVCLPHAIGERNAMATCCATYLIYVLVEKYAEASERFVFGGGISKFSKFLGKDFCAKYLSKWQARGLTDLDRMCLIPYFDSVLGDKSDIIQPPVSSGVPNDEICNNILQNFQIALFSHAAKTIQAVCSRNDRMRKLVTQDTTLMQNLQRWFTVPPLTNDDQRKTIPCLTTFQTLPLSADISNFLVTEFGILKILEFLVYTPDRTRLRVYLNVIQTMTSHRNLYLKKKILENELIMKVLVATTNSFDLDLKKAAIYTFFHLSESPLAERILTSGFNLYQMIKLNDFHDPSQICCLMARIRKNLNIKCPRAMYTQYEETKKLRYKFDSDKAMKKKEEGNKLFKEGNYSEAIIAYQMAIEFAAPSIVEQCCESLHLERFAQETCDHSSPRKQSSVFWDSLPATLYTNRAQCHLKLGEYKKAVDDCDEAIARCLEDNPEAPNFLLKSVWRRSKGLYELGLYQRALLDASFCISQNKRDPYFKQHFDKVYLKYRTHMDNDMIRRCSLCLGGEGKKLKRCAKCDELYCSRKCQKDSWVACHHMLCPGLSEEEQERNKVQIEEVREILGLEIKTKD